MKAPVYEPQVNTNPLPATTFGVQANGLDDASRSIAQSFSNASDAINHVVAKEKEKADDTMSLDAISQLSAYTNTALFDKDQGFLNKKGKDAIDTSHEYVTNFDETARNLRAGLTNDSQRLAFDRHAASERDGFQRNVLSHENQQNEAFQTSVFNTFQETNKNTAALNFNNPDMVQGLIHSTYEAAEKRARLNGADDAGATFAAKSAASDVLASALISHSNTDPDAAKAEFEKVRDQFPDAEKAEVLGNKLDSAIRQKASANYLEYQENEAGYKDLATQWQDPNFGGDRLLPDMATLQSQVGAKKAAKVLSDLQEAKEVGEGMGELQHASPEEAIDILNKRDPANRPQVPVDPNAPVPAVDPNRKIPLSERNNNPGNLRDPKTGDFRVFATKEEGAQAMRDDLSAKVSGNSNAMKAKYGQNYTPTLTTVISTYAPPSENNTSAYIDTVSKATGIPADQALSDADIEKIMPVMARVEGGPNSSALASADGYTREKRVHDKLAQAWVQHMKTLSEDPGGVVANTDAVKAKWQVANDAIASNDPAAQSLVQNAVGASINEQIRLGVRPDQVAPLAKNQAKSIVGEVTNAFANRQDVQQKMVSMQKMYGPHWSRVLSQLVEEKLPEPAIALGMMDGPNQVIPGKMLSEAITEGKEVYTAIGDANTKAIKENVDGELGDFFKSVGYQAGSVQVQNAVRSSVELLAAKYVQANGLSPSKATKQAANDVINSRYSFEGTYRVPVELNVNAVRAGANRDLEELSDWIKFDNPDGTPASDADRLAYSKSVVANGHWVNTPEDDGLMLMDEKGNYVMRPDGTPVRHTYNEFIQHDAAYRKQALDIALFGQENPNIKYGK